MPDSLGVAAPPRGVYAVLRGLGLGHLKVFRERGRFRRYERPVPGELGHIDAKMPRLGVGGGHRFGDGATTRRHRGFGYVYEHVLVDDRTRVSYGTWRVRSPRRPHGGRVTPSDKWRAEPRSGPDSGDPTVRGSQGGFEKRDSGKPD